MACCAFTTAHAQSKPNILVIWGDDLGTWNISANNRGMMGYRTPNIDRIAVEGVSFTDYYGQQSCTAGRAAFLNGSVPVRTGMTKVGVPGSPECRGRAGERRLSEDFCLGERPRPTRRAPQLGGWQGWPEDRGHRPADAATEGDDRRGNPRRGQGLHPASAQGGQAFLRVVECHAHALPHAREGAAPWHFRAGTTLNGIVSHEDWLPTFAAIAGEPDLKTKLAQGTSIGGRSYRNFVDGANQIDYLSGKSRESARDSFIHVNDDGNIVAIRCQDWKAVYMENRARQFAVWQEPFVELRVPLLCKLRHDPFELSQHNSNTCNDWLLEHVYWFQVIGDKVAMPFLQSLVAYPPSQKPGSFNLNAVKSMIEQAAARK